jgi:hypothetical protein
MDKKTINEFLLCLALIACATGITAFRHGDKDIAITMIATAGAIYRGQSQSKDWPDPPLPTIFPERLMALRLEA